MRTVSSPPHPKQWSHSISVCIRRGFHTGADVVEKGRKWTTLSGDIQEIRTTILLSKVRRICSRMEEKVPVQSQFHAEVLCCHEAVADLSICLQLGNCFSGNDTVVEACGGGSAGEHSVHLAALPPSTLLNVDGTFSMPALPSSVE
ncbi:hypothetical protein NEOLEDRAFT_308002 [Neolentinus lepideus HHB14362 ss-1]|uniref:Uncharacterized protein n=1 Tax=Neolentinus lepideus HHB14362 ss-1 TaxID=1314782 RepID=A0A165VRY1_9AGAM|nr:hypothetical protein NEOLEDRAFT_308002 [Neolentinus lepideus HHB14362 ss-1]